MDERSQALVLIALLCILSFVFQVQCKLLASEIAASLSKPGQIASQKAILVIREAFTWRPLLVAALALAAFSVWLLVLMRLELSMALPLAAVALVVNSVGSGLLLGEALNSTRHRRNSHGGRWHHSGTEVLNARHSQHCVGVEAANGSNPDLSPLPVIRANRSERNAVVPGVDV